jgi:hypothetical protein
MSLEPEIAYHNQHDPAKGFTHVRVRAGYVPQSQEINELQSIQDTQREKLGNLLFTSGSIQRGGGYNKTGSQMALEETSIWFNGRVLTAPAKTLGMNDAGTETVGILVSEILVTGTGINADSALLEPDIDALNYGLEGANRTKITAEWVRNNANAVPVYTFVEGVQQVAVPSSQIDPVNAAMARRTYAESGNYVVTGFEVEVREANTNSLVFSYKVGNQGDNKRNGSLAYVKGNEIAKLVPDYVTVDKALTKFAAFEQFTYAPTDPDVIDSAELAFALPAGKQPPELDATTTTVRAIFDVFIPVSGHNANGTDPLTLGSGHTLTDILRVYKDADINAVSDPDTVYLKAATQSGPGAWYREGDSIKWDASSAGISAWSTAPTAYTEGQVVSYLGNTWQAKQASSGQAPAAGAYWQQVSISEPSNGDSYYAYALVSRVLSASEYVVENNNGVWQLNVSPLVTRPYAKNKINDQAVSSLVTVNYNFYLPRVDVVYVDGLGVVSVQQGTPGKAPIAPSVPGDVLALAQVTVGGGLAPTIAIKPYTTKRKTMLEIQDMDQRLRRLELNVALKDLDDQGISKARDVMATLRGILTEGFAYTIDDIQEDSDEDSRLKFVLDATTSGCLDVSRRQLTLPLLEAAPVPVVPTGTNSGGTFALTLDEAGYFYPDTYLDQQKRTNTLRVNQFDFYISPPTVEIHPRAGSPENDNAIIKTYDPTSAAAVAQLYKANWKDYTQGLAAPQKSFVKGKLNDFMKREWVWVYGNGYPANTLIEIRVDGRAPKLRAAHPTIATFPFNAGTVPTTAIVQPSGAAATTATVDGVAAVYPETCLVRTTSLGKFGCAILIPEGLPTGAVAIAAVAQDAAQKGSQAVYTVQGTLSIEDNGAAAMYQMTELTDFAFNQVAPTITNMVIKVGGVTVVPANGIYNYTASSNITVEVYWDKGSANRAGLPREIVLLVKGSGKSGKLTKVSGDAGFDLDAGFATFSGDVLNSCATGLEFAAFASNVRGTGQPFKRTIRYQDQVPTHFAVSVDTLLQPTNVGGSNVFQFGYTAGTNVSNVVAKYTLPDGTQVTLTPVA